MLKSYTSIHYEGQAETEASKDTASRLKVQKLLDQSESSSVFLRGLYSLGTECVRSVGTEWVWS